MNTYQTTGVRLVSAVFAALCTVGLLFLVSPAFANAQSAESIVCPYTWTVNLGDGDTGTDVLKLQQFLNEDPDTVLAQRGGGSPGNETGVYGARTIRAVKKFQEKYAADILAPTGQQKGSGYFDDLTRDKANVLCNGEADGAAAAPAKPVETGVDRDALMDERFGFGADVLGGYNGETYVVTSLEDNGTGTLRAALESADPLWVTFDVSGVIALDSKIRVKSYKTIDGRGADITLTNHGLAIYNANDVIVHNISIRDGVAEAYDGIEVLRSGNVWVDHVTFSNFPDGLIDIRNASTTTRYLTVSNNKFENHDKVSIVGLHNPDAPNDSEIYATYAYNYFQGTTQRHPRVAQAYVHAYNNVIEWQSYGIASFDRGRVLSENNWYVAPSASRPRATDINHGGYSGDYLIPDGYLRSNGDSVENGAVVTTNNEAAVADPTYTYRLQKTTNRNKQKVMNGAGAQVSGAVASASLTVDESVAQTQSVRTVTKQEYAQLATLLRSLETALRKLKG